MNLTLEQETPHFPSDKYPEHWGPFELHTMVPYDRGLKALEVTNYQIVIEYKPANSLVVVGFDDFAPAWPMDRDAELSHKAIRRRDKYREMAQFRALVKIQKVKHLSAEGIEQLRDAGADVSEEACRQGLWIAVYGKYDNYPNYQPGKNAKHLISVQVIHQDESQTVRNLYIASMDPRTAVRSFLYFERIKLLRFIEDVSKKDNGRTEIEDRSIEWFVNKMMEMFPTDETSVPEKRDNYRGARRHRSEARHVFVCHAEWLLAYTRVHLGTDRQISRAILEEWVSLAPRMRELAAREGRAGWGVWDAVWDKVDFTEWFKKEQDKFKYYLKVLSLEERQEKSTASSSRSERYAVRSTRPDKGKGRATTADEEHYAYRWIPDPISDEEEDDGGISLDEAEQAGRAKRPRISPNQDVGPSGAQLTRSSPSLGELGDRISSSLSRDHYQPSPSLGRAGWGVWDAVWDKVDFTEWFKKEQDKFKYYLKVLSLEERQEKSTASSSRSERYAVRSTRPDKGKGRATTEDEEHYAYRWIPDPISDEEEDDGGISLDEAEQAGRAKRPRISSSQDVGPSGAQLTRSSPSLGELGDRISSSLSRDHYQPSPSLGTRTPSSGRNPTATSQFHGSARGSFPRTPSSSGRNPSSSWMFTSQKGPSPPTPATSRKSLETRLPLLSAQARPQPSETTDIIYVSSDDDDIPMLTANVARSSIAPKSEVIDITDSPSEDGDESMRAVSEVGEIEDPPPQDRDGYDEPPYPRQRTSVPRETVVGETPPPGSRLQPSSGRPESPPIEEVSDSQEEFDSSDSESKYGQPVPRPPTPKRQRVERLKELNDKILLFAPLVHSTAYAPQTWKPWRCNYPTQRLRPGCDPKAAHMIPCTFEIDLRRPSLEVKRLLNQDPGDAELLGHLLTVPCIFRGPTDELPVAIFTRVVELHRQEHFRDWGVKRVITDSGGRYRAHFEPLDESGD
ncbi:hypothetical protein RSAG8_05430, partial [Rhizoctonia solani AG-8 WAC10335]